MKTKHCWKKKSNLCEITVFYLKKREHVELNAKHQHEKNMTKFVLHSCLQAK
jgi:hypothetical protein